MEADLRPRRARRGPPHPVAAGGQNYNEEDDTFSTGLAEGSNTYSISFDSLTGTGTGFRADVIVNGDGSLSLGTVRDKGKGYAVGDRLEISTDPTVRGVSMFDAAAEGFRIEVASISNANDDDSETDDDDDSSAEGVSVISVV